MPRLGAWQEPLLLLLPSGPPEPLQGYWIWAEVIVLAVFTQEGTFTWLPLSGQQWTIAATQRVTFTKNVPLVSFVLMEGERGG